MIFPLLFAGTCIGHLGSDVRKKLKAAYTLIEQLYTGAQRIITTASHNNPVPTLIQDTLNRLSMLPARIKALMAPVRAADFFSSSIRAGSIDNLLRVSWIKVGAGFRSC